jgi:hypothetical protein
MTTDLLGQASKIRKTKEKGMFVRTRWHQQERLLQYSFFLWPVSAKNEQ